jgi:hypothetical protein
MPQLVTFAGMPVKRRRRVAAGLLLTFYSACPGKPGRALVVSDAEWRRDGRIEFFTSDSLPNVRRLAADRSSS